MLCLLVSTIAFYLYFKFDAPVWHSAVAAVFGFGLWLSRKFIQKHVLGSAWSLIIIMYLAAGTMKFVVVGDVLSDFGLIFLYAIPFIALVFISRQVANFLKFINLIPFTLVLTEYFLKAQVNNQIPAFNYVYLHLLMFMFFNFILPFAMQQMIHEAWQSTAIRRKAHQSVVSRNNLYQTLFKLSRQPSLIIKHNEGLIVDSNDALVDILDEGSLTKLKNIILSKNMEINKAYNISVFNRYFLIWRKKIEQSSGSLYVLEEVTQLRLVTKELHDLADKSHKQQLEDSGTHLPNREALALYLESLPSEGELSFLICAKPELSEHFSRKMNAEEFHLLQLKYSQLIKESLSTDYIAKISRHYFAFVITGKKIDKVKLKIEKLHVEISKLKDNDLGDFGLVSKFSHAQISMFKGDIRYLIDQTENRLTQATLGEYIVSYQPEHDNEKLNHLTLRASLSRAIERNEFSIVLQPKVKASGELEEFEALLRWNKGGEIIPPSVFIPLAEQCGLIGRITDWLIDQVCHFLSEQIRSKSKVFPISINISALDLERLEFVDSVLRYLTIHNVPPMWLGIELTETALLKNDNNAIEQLRKLQVWGIKISIDDFGIGYSSLSRIVEFPLDVLKLDRSFLFKLDEDNRRLVLIQSMVTLCQSLNILVVAEGVETQEELNKLASFFPISFQGYYFSEPLSLQQVTSVCTRTSPQESIIFPLPV